MIQFLEERRERKKPCNLLKMNFAAVIICKSNLSFNRILCLNPYAVSSKDVFIEHHYVLEVVEKKDQRKFHSLHISYGGVCNGV